jgi:hypothetical protein
MDAAVGLYRHHFGTLLGVVALVWAPLMALQLACGAVGTGMTSSWTGEKEMPWTAFAGMMAVLAVTYSLAGLANLIFAPLAGGAVVRAVSEMYLGRPVTVMGAYRQVTRWWLPLIGAHLLIQLIVGGIAAALAMILAVLGGALLAFWPVTGAVVIGLAVLLALSAALVGFLLLMAVVPAIVIENRGVIEALQRSYRLVRPRLGPVFGAWALLGLLTAVPVLMAYGAYAAAIALGAQPGLQDPAGTGALAGWMALGGAVVACAIILVKPIMSVGLVVIYYDLRVRQEGFDLEMMAASLATPSRPAPSPPAPLLGGGGPPSPPPAPPPLPPQDSG